jgi:hypothetical protein
VQVYLPTALALERGPVFIDSLKRESVYPKHQPLAGGVDRVEDCLPPGLHPDVLRRSPPNKLLVLECHVPATRNAMEKSDDPVAAQIGRSLPWLLPAINIVISEAVAEDSKHRVHKLATNNCFVVEAGYPGDIHGSQGQVSLTHGLEREVGATKQFAEQSVLHLVRKHLANDYVRRISECGRPPIRRLVYPTLFSARGLDYLCGETVTSSRIGLNNLALCAERRCQGLLNDRT